MIAAPTNLDLEGIVTDVADRFQRDWGVEVTGTARSALLEPARQHQQKIEEELSEGRITLEFLEGAIRQVLSAARDIARQEAETQLKDAEDRRTSTKDRRASTQKRQGKDRRKRLEEGNKIEDRHIIESIKKDCPYIPWC